MSARLRHIARAAVVVVLLLGIAYTTYVGYEASRQAVNVDEHRSRDCRTPDLIEGWSYEAINYPIEDDAAIRRANADMRNCASQGVKAGTQTTLGVLEQNDLRAIVDWVERTKKPAHLALFGNSMGSAAAIGEARHDPRVAALALDSMHTRIVYQFEQRLTAAGHPAYPGTWPRFWGPGCAPVSGSDQPIPPTRWPTWARDRSCSPTAPPIPRTFPLAPRPSTTMRRLPG